MSDRLERGKRGMSGQIFMSLDAWTVVDLIAYEDGTSPGKVIQRLIDAEAKRRLDAKAAMTKPEPEPKKRRSPVLSDERRAELRIQAAHARAIRAQKLASREIQ